ncbi:MAG: hypothetical protein KAT77_05125 [Nanoarchaeota archaeon]|nr:hypothetical protein [Nanoarchaeota archaeon]
MVVNIAVKVIEDLIDEIKPSLKGFSKDKTRPIDFLLDPTTLNHVSGRIELTLKNIIIPKLEAKIKIMKSQGISWWTRRKYQKIRNKLLKLKKYHVKLKSGKLPSVFGAQYNQMPYLRPFEIIQGEAALIE